jgi:hypothetical protein
MRAWLLLSISLLGGTFADPLQTNDEGKVVVNVGALLFRSTSAGAIAMAVDDAAREGLLSNISLR